MSTIGLVSSHDSLYKNSNNHRRKHSDELDVFEAAQYFSGDIGQSTIPGQTISTLSDHLHHQKTTMMRSNERKIIWGGRNRISLDMSLMMRNQNLSQSPRIEKYIMKDEIKHQKPNSPSSKLASIFNSLFNLKSSRRKKSSVQDFEDQESKSSSAGRKRSSSISYFQSLSKTSTTNDHYRRKSSVFHSSSLSTGYRTPPPLCTPSKINRDLPKYSGSKVSSISDLQEDDEEKLNFINGFLEKNSESSSNEKKDNNQRRVCHQVENQMNMDEDDGGESDSSSDLFELQNYDLGDLNYSSELPIHETTQVDKIKN